MARLHSSLGDRTVYTTAGTAKAQGLLATVYENAAGTILADLAVYDPQDADVPGATIAGAVLTVDAYSNRPAFWDLNDRDELYITVNGGPLEPIRPDAQPQIVALDERVTAVEPGGTGAALLRAANLADLASASTARANLGLGNSATRAVGSGSGDVAAGTAPAAAQAAAEATAAAALTGHVGDTTDVHGIADTAALELTTNKGAADGYAPLDGSTLVPVENLPTLPGVAGIGPIANRPAASADNIGHLYFETDIGGGTPVYSDGTVWPTFAAAAHHADRHVIGHADPLTLRQIFNAPMYSIPVATGVHGTPDGVSGSQPLLYGDQTHDDALAVNYVIQQCATNGGGIVLIPDGSWYCQTTITPAAWGNNVTLMGGGEYVTKLIRASGADIILMDASGTANDFGHMAKRISILKLNLDGGLSLGTPNTSSKPILRTFYGTQYRFDEVDVVNGAGNGWRILQLWDSMFMQCRVDNCGGPITSPNASPTTPAVQIINQEVGTISGQFGYSSDSVNNLKFIQFTIESYRDGALWIDGSGGFINGCNGLTFIDLKCDSTSVNGPAIVVTAGLGGGNNQQRKNYNLSINGLVLSSGNTLYAGNTGPWDALTIQDTAGLTISNAIITPQSASNGPSLKNCITFSGNNAGVLLDNVGASGANLVGAQWIPYAFLNFASGQNDVNAPSWGRLDHAGGVTPLMVGFPTTGIIAPPYYSTYGGNGSNELTGAVYGGQTMVFVSGGQGLSLFVTGDTNPRLQAKASGAILLGPGNAPGDVTIARSSQAVLGVTGRVVPTDGLTMPSKVGVPLDADFTVTPADGTQKYNSSDAHPYVRSAAAWKQYLLAGDADAILVPTAVKTSAYAAVAGNYVPVDTTAGSVTITLPSAPADKTRIGVKMVATASSNTVTVNRAGSDVFNKAGGATSVSLSVVNQGVVMQYASATGIWYVQAETATGSASGSAGGDLAGTYPNPTVVWTNGHPAGLLASRPAAAAGNAGYLYFATDVNGGTLYRSDGATWTAQAPGVTQSGGAPTNHAKTHGKAGSDELFINGGHGRDSAVENGPRWAFTSSGNAITASRQYFMYFTPSNDITVSKVSMLNATAAIGATLVRMGLYTLDGSGNLTLVARTANDTTIFNTANSENQRAFDTAGGFPASYALVAGTRYAFSFIVVGASTQPTISGANNTGVGNALSSVTPYITRYNSGSPVDLATTLTFVNTTFINVVFYVAGVV